MTKMRYATVFAALFGLGLVILYATGGIDRVFYQPFNRGEVDTDTNASEVSLEDNATFAVRLPEKMVFAGEPVPMNSMDVRERLDRELTVNCYWHSSTILMMKRAHRWFPTIERILREQGVPEDFKYLALAESGLQDVVSPAGATGFWQFMKAAAGEHGLKVNPEVDERYHVEKATVAACRYLKSLKSDFGSWTMAAAAYNMGQNGLRKQIGRQEEQNYYDLILSDETSRYVFRILALKAICSSPDDFGFYLTEQDLYPPYRYKEVVVRESVESWPEFCDKYDITYRQLKLLNPWLRDTYLTNSEGREYTIKIMQEQG